MPVSTAALVRRAAVLEVGGFDGAMPVQGYEDWDLWLSLVERGHRGVIFPEVLFFYRRRAGSMSTVCNVGDAHVALMHYLVGKHDASYRTHHRAVLAQRDAAIADCLRSYDTLDWHLVTELAPAIARRRLELEQLSERLVERSRESAAANAAAELAGQLQALGVERVDARRRYDASAAALAAARHEVAALRSSLSWRITGPVRALYDSLRRLAGPRP